jgi:hypothetical protein
MKRQQKNLLKILNRREEELDNIKSSEICIKVIYHDQQQQR